MLSSPTRQPQDPRPISDESETMRKTSFSPWVSESPLVGYCLACRLQKRAKRSSCAALSRLMTSLNKISHAYLVCAWHSTTEWRQRTSCKIWQAFTSFQRTWRGWECQENGRNQLGPWPEDSIALGDVRKNAETKIRFTSQKL